MCIDLQSWHMSENFFAVSETLTSKERSCWSRDLRSAEGGWEQLWEEQKWLACGAGGHPIPTAQHSILYKMRKEKQEIFRAQTG